MGTSHKCLYLLHIFTGGKMQVAPHSPSVSRPSYNRIVLPENPVGWYQLGLSSEIGAEKLVTKKLVDHEIVLYRTKSGELKAIDPYCPHLGAHLGHGGRVCGEEIVCPFHGFRFAKDGSCTQTGYGTEPPPKSRIAHWHVKEADGFVFAFYHPKGEAPYFDVPEQDQEGWMPVLSTNFVLNGHPQETTENSVDIGHFGEVHKYTNIKEIKPMSYDGPYLTATYGMSRKAVVGSGLMDVEFEIHAWGFGYSFVEATIAKYGLKSRHYVLSTPIGDGKIDLRIGCAVKIMGSPARVNPLLALFPKSIATRLIAGPTFKGYQHDVLQDYDIWNNKIHIVPPILAKGDGPVGKYRRWAKQFYVGGLPDVDEPAAAVA